MAPGKLDIDRLLTVASRDEMRALLRGPVRTPSLPEAQRLAAHAAALSPNLTKLRLGVVHTYTSDLLDPWFAFSGALQGFEIEPYHAAYGLNLHEALDGSGLLSHRPDITLLLLQREDIHPELSNPVTALAPAEQETLRNEALDRLSMITGTFRAVPVGQLVVTLLPASAPPSLGLYDLQVKRLARTHLTRAGMHSRPRHWKTHLPSS